MAKKRAPKPSFKPSATTGQHPVVAITVHADFSGQETAFRLGFYHCYERAKPRQPESFIHKPTATAYAAGLMAGCAARAAKARTQ